MDFSCGCLQWRHGAFRPYCTVAENYELLRNVYESGNFEVYFRILAFKLIFEHPERYGYYFKKENLYPPIPSKEIVVKEDILLNLLKNKALIIAFCVN